MLAIGLYLLEVWCTVKNGSTISICQCTVVQIFVVVLFYALATVFQLYLGSDMMYEMRRRKAEPTYLPSQGILNLILHIGKV